MLDVISCPVRGRSTNFNLIKSEQFSPISELDKIQMGGRSSNDFIQYSTNVGKKRYTNLAVTEVIK